MHASSDFGNICMFISFIYLISRFTSAQLWPRPQSPFSLTGLCFLLTTPFCNQNLILCNQFPMKTPPAPNVHTFSLNSVSKLTSARRHKSSKHPTEFQYNFRQHSGCISTCNDRQNMLIALKSLKCAIYSNISEIHFYADNR